MGSKFIAPFELQPLFRERVWGRTSLEPYFAQTPGNERIGEVWFTSSENRTASGQSLGELLTAHPEILGSAALPHHPGLCPLLVKLLFTSDRLSVQVHPDDRYAQQHHGSLGKTEAWYVLGVEPPSEIAVGFRQSLTPERFAASIPTGEIEQLLAWRSVESGDTIFVPAGTVHAIGAGCVICEIQENSDITYRLYDYGRPRELHLEHGIKVSRLTPHPNGPPPVPLSSIRDTLLQSEYFQLERLRPATRFAIPANQPHYALLICVQGAGVIAGQPFTPGRCWLIPARGDTVEVSGPGSEWILTYTSQQHLDITN